jgi:hypothetical protein
MRMTFNREELLSVPADCAQAVHVFADRQAVREHASEVRALYCSHVLAAEQEAAVSELVGRSAGRAEDLSRKIWQPSSNRGRAAFCDLDVARRSPGSIAMLTRVQWLIGALAGLAFVRAAHADALIGARGIDTPSTVLLLRSLERYLEDSDRRWSIQWSRIAPGRRATSIAGAVRLVGLETPSPRFEADLTGGQEEGDV